MVVGYAGYIPKSPTAKKHITDLRLQSVCNLSAFIPLDSNYLKTFINLPESECSQSKSVCDSLETDFQWSPQLLASVT